jgi:hypothetical protein
MTQTDVRSKRDVQLTSEPFENETLHQSMTSQSSDDSLNTSMTSQPNDNETLRQTFVRLTRHLKQLAARNEKSAPMVGNTFNVSNAFCL